MIHMLRKVPNDAKMELQMVKRRWQQHSSSSSSINPAIRPHTRPHASAKAARVAKWRRAFQHALIRIPPLL